MMKSGRFGRSGSAQSNIKAVVKWFNTTKGFGFVQPEDGSPDAFLHASVLQDSGHSAVGQGAVLTCDIAEGQRGPQVVAISDVIPGEDPFASQPPMGGGGGGRDAWAPRGPRPGGPGGAPRDRDFGGPTETLEGTVKFFNAQKGFGFILPDDGGKDVFISAKTLEMAGIHGLEPNQRVRVSVRQGHKGPMAATVELA